MAAILGVLKGDEATEATTTPDAALAPDA